MNLAHKFLCITALVSLIPATAPAKETEALFIGPFTTEVSEESFLSTLKDPVCREGPNLSKICEGSFPDDPDIKVSGEIYDNLLESVKVSFPLNKRAYIENEIVRKNGKSKGGVAGWAVKKLDPSTSIWTGKKRGESLLMLMCGDKSCSATLQGKLAIKRYKECKKANGEQAIFFC